MFLKLSFSDGHQQVSSLTTIYKHPLSTHSVRFVYTGIVTWCHESLLPVNECNASVATSTCTPAIRAVESKKLGYNKPIKTRRILSEGWLIIIKCRSTSHPDHLSFIRSSSRVWTPTWHQHPSWHAPAPDASRSWRLYVYKKHASTLDLSYRRPSSHHHSPPFPAIRSLGPLPPEQALWNVTPRKMLLERDSVPFAFQVF